MASPVGQFLPRHAELERARFAPDLAESVAWGDERHGQIMALVHKVVSERALPPPEIEPPPPFDPTAPGSVSLSGFDTVLFAGGFRPAYRSWLPWPEALDDHRFPVARAIARRRSSDV